jgi:hypothetical protein
MSFVFPNGIGKRIERRPVLIVNLVDRANIRMIQCRRGLRFAFEAGERLLIFSNFVRQEFQGHKAMQLHVLGFVDDPIPPPPTFSTT